MGPAAGRATTESGDFFLPDLCAPRSVLAIVLLSELLVIAHVLARSGLADFDWTLLSAGSLIVLWISLLSAALLCQLRGPLSRLDLVPATAACLAVVAAVTLFSSFVAQRLPPPFGGADLTNASLLRNVLVALVVAGVALRYFYLQHQLRRQEKLEMQSRLDSLRSRIRPHFLFNTLNSIASLIVSRPDAAERAVEDLSELFRASLREEAGDTTVADELHLCELYLGIEQLRLGDRLRVDWQVADEARAAPMPSLILQPLVENAIYHGIAALPDGGTVVIAINVAGDEIHAVIENPLGNAGSAPAGHQMALDNIRRRLDALYGPAAAIELFPGPGRFRVELTYPREAAV